jgi:hypothetical protein
MKPFEHRPSIGAPAFPAGPPYSQNGRHVPPAGEGATHSAFQSTQYALARKGLFGNTWVGAAVAAVAVAVLAWVVSGSTSAPNERAVVAALEQQPETNGSAPPSALSANAPSGTPAAAEPAAPAPPTPAEPAPREAAVNAATAVQADTAAKPEREARNKTKKKGRAGRSSRQRAAAQP